MVVEVVETALACLMEDVVIEFDESFPLLALAIDKEEMLVLVCTLKERGKVFTILGTSSLVDCKAVSPGLCAYLLLFHPRLINISRAVLAESC